MVSKNAPISLLKSKRAIEHGAFSADSPGNQAVGHWETLRAGERLSAWGKYGARFGAAVPAPARG